MATKPIQARLDPELHRHLKAAVAYRQTSIQDVMRKAAETFIRDAKIDRDFAGEASRRVTE